jgi:hypothetical protein
MKIIIGIMAVNTILTLILAFMLVYYQKLKNMNKSKNIGGE